mgnify:CR=1 FL=1
MNEQLLSSCKLQQRFYRQIISVMYMFTETLNMCYTHHTHHKLLTCNVKLRVDYALDKSDIHLNIYDGI